MLERIRRAIGLALALVTCPCHLPVTAPLLLSLLAGTALGTYLSSHLEVLAAAAILLFLGGLALAFMGSGDPKRAPGAACPPARTSPHRRR
ncbi:hypothetical protein HRbin22_00993 [Candidatus Thermoflexus japonica]|uniref:Uncharacterized protein n=1 Tax=Candidatus Thermoflexus japonica TaxID=2035417 RepID=A0A2H5Y5S9_9CHLR|nr:hypothetical protein HRbin22_00993 [Candidatus Thermoflexus japonica]